MAFCSRFDILNRRHLLRQWSRCYVQRDCSDCSRRTRGGASRRSIQIPYALMSVGPIRRNAQGRPQCLATVYLLCVIKHKIIHYKKIIFSNCSSMQFQGCFQRNDSNYKDVLPKKILITSAFIFSFWLLNISKGGLYECLKYRRNTLKAGMCGVAFSKTLSSDYLLVHGLK